MSEQLSLWLRHSQKQQQKGKDKGVGEKAQHQHRPPLKAIARMPLTSKNLDEKEQKQRQAIEVLLADQPEAFKLTVFELCRQLGWPDDEPGFLLAVVSNRLYAMAQEYPLRLSEAMQAATKTAFDQWQLVQTKLDVAAVKQDTALGQLNSQLLKVQVAALDQLQGTQQFFKREREAMQLALDQERSRMAELLEAERQALSDERAQVVALLAEEQKSLAQERLALRQVLEDERAAMAAAAQQQVEEQQAVLEKKASVVLATVVERAQQGMAQEVQRIVKVVRPKHYAEATCYVFLAVALLSSLSWMVAWKARGLTEAATVWGDIERWNQDHLQACIEAQQATCSIHIEVPEHPVEQ